MSIDRIKGEVSIVLRDLLSIDRIEGYDRIKGETILKHVVWTR